MNYGTGRTYSTVLLSSHNVRKTNYMQVFGEPDGVGLLNKLFRLSSKTVNSWLLLTLETCWPVPTMQQMLLGITTYFALVFK